MKALYLLNAIILFILCFIFWIVLLEGTEFFTSDLIGIFIYFLLFLWIATFFYFALLYWKIWLWKIQMCKKTNISLFLSLWGILWIAWVYAWVFIECWYLQWSNDCGGDQGLNILIFWIIPFILTQIISSITLFIHIRKKNL